MQRSRSSLARPVRSGPKIAAPRRRSRTPRRASLRTRAHRAQVTGATACARTRQSRADNRGPPRPRPPVRSPARERPPNRRLFAPLRSWETPMAEPDRAWTSSSSSSRERRRRYCRGVADRSERSGCHRRARDLERRKCAGSCEPALSLCNAEQEVKPNQCGAVSTSGVPNHPSKSESRLAPIARCRRRASSRCRSLVSVSPQNFIPAGLSNPHAAADPDAEPIEQSPFAQDPTRSKLATLLRWFTALTMARSSSGQFHATQTIACSPENPLRVSAAPMRR